MNITLRKFAILLAGKNMMYRGMPIKMTRAELSGAHKLTIIFQALNQDDPTLNYEFTGQTSIELDADITDTGDVLTKDQQSAIIQDIHAAIDNDYAEEFQNQSLINILKHVKDDKHLDPTTRTAYVPVYTDQFVHLLSKLYTSYDGASLIIQDADITKDDVGKLQTLTVSYLYKGVVHTLDQDINSVMYDFKLLTLKQQYHLMSMLVSHINHASTINIDRYVQDIINESNEDLYPEVY